MGNLGDTFEGWRKISQDKCSDNREKSTEILSQAGISFTVKNQGAHLIVEGRECLIDFWPGTGKFIARNGKKGRGVLNLLKLLEEPVHWGTAPEGQAGKST